MLNPMVVPITLVRKGLDGSEAQLSQSIKLVIRWDLPL